MRPPFILTPVVRKSGRKKVRKEMESKWVGFYPFRGPDASLTQR